MIIAIYLNIKIARMHRQTSGTPIQHAYLSCMRIGITICSSSLYGASIYQQHCTRLPVHIDNHESLSSTRIQWHFIHQANHLYLEHTVNNQAAPRETALTKSSASRPMHCSHLSYPPIRIFFVLLSNNYSDAGAALGLGLGFGGVTSTTTSPFTVVAGE